MLRSGQPARSLKISESNAIATKNKSKHINRTETSLSNSKFQQKVMCFVLFDCLSAESPIGATTSHHAHPKLRLTLKPRCAVTLKLRAHIRNCAPTSKTARFIRNCLLTSETTRSHPNRTDIRNRTHIPKLRTHMRNCTLNAR